MSELDDSVTAGLPKTIEQYFWGTDWQGEYPKLEDLKVSQPQDWADIIRLKALITTELESFADKLKERPLEAMLEGDEWPIDVIPVADIDRLLADKLKELGGK